MDKSFTEGLPSVPVASSPFVVVDGPSLNHRSAAIEGSLLRFVGLVAFEALVSHLNGLLFACHADHIVRDVNKDWFMPALRTVMDGCDVNGPEASSGFPFVRMSDAGRPCPRSCRRGDVPCRIRLLSWSHMPIRRCVGGRVPIVR